MDNKKTENKKTGRKRDEDKRQEKRKDEDKRPENRKKDGKRPRNRKKDERKENSKKAGAKREEGKKQEKRRENAGKNDNRREEQKRADSRREEIRRNSRRRKKDSGIKGVKGDWTVDDKLSMILAADNERTEEGKASADSTRADGGKASADSTRTDEGKASAGSVQPADTVLSVKDDRTKERGSTPGKDQPEEDKTPVNDVQTSVINPAQGYDLDIAGEWTDRDDPAMIPDEGIEDPVKPEGILEKDDEKAADPEGSLEKAAGQDKVQVIGVRFRTNGKIYYFSAGELTVKTGTNVIVETARGVEYGKVVMGIREVEEKRIISTLKPVIRIATPEDDQINEDNKAKSKEAYAICQDKIKKHGLDMKLIDCEYTFDNNKVLFYFTADGRIDFRELVKDLAAVFKTRIELRQIGVRDETKIMGGIGICGRELCCNTYLSEFIPVSIKMAKEQNLSLNPTKISGACGRLMCCLKNEQDTYEYLNKKLPNPGDEVRLPEGGKGVVQSVNVLRQKVKVIITDEKDEKELVEYNAADLNFYARKKKDKVKVDGDLKKLEALEKKERKARLS